ncbi:amino acid permease [Coralloluteibacterium stylophorae]|uniref:Arginine/agmatine antiporter n=1 Tax=Coralloluteibacterium stylophorae TaxID=1776034 RepID=A0A8J7VTN8_9GAMM|nr:APC family permease [Coralloluteibacterium stylophorae]MBS7456165.1 amino acid permease [Coralloluteibacterium stylophorae]
MPVDPALGGLARDVGRWQVLGLSINDVVGSGIYLLPATVFLLLGPLSVWAVLLAGCAVGLLVLCYAQAASYFDAPGASYLYAREAFGPFVGFQVGWTVWLTRVAVAASLSNGLADAVQRFWPAAADGAGRMAVVAGSLALLTALNVVGVRWAARAGVAMTLGKLIPLLLFVAIGAFHIDWGLAGAGKAPDAGDLRTMSEAALLLLFAYAGFENLPAAAGEYRNPRRDVPFALLTMITVVTLVYAAVQLVAQGTLPGLAQSSAPVADAGARLAGEGFALLITVGAAVSILGTNSNTMLLGPRFLYALSVDGYGPRAFSRISPRYRTPALAIVVQGGLALVLALTGSFVGLALLSTLTRLCAYMATAAAVLVLRRRHPDRPGVLRLPGGPLIPVSALLLTAVLFASASLANLLAVGLALLVGAAIYRFWRRPGPPGEG